MSLFATSAGLSFLAQLDFSNFTFPGGVRGFTGFTMLVHIFSTGATFAVLFLVLLVGFYPRVTAALFTHFFYFVAIAMASMLLALWGMYSYYYKWDRYSVLSKRRHALLGFTMGGFIWNPRSACRRL